MAEPTGGLELGHIAALLAAGVIAVPVFRRLGLGSVLGYLAAGLAIGPFGFALFREPEVILHVAEFGVVIFLFIIGLEMRPSRLWKLKRDIFGLGAAQVAAAGLLLTLTGMAAGLSVPVAFVGAMGFVLSSTAVIMQTLDERGELNSPKGQRGVSILLLEDIAIVPLLAAVAVMAGAMGLGGETAPPLWRTVGLAIGAIAVVFLAGRFLINPVFRILARYGGREVMTAAALRVVVGAAWLMNLGGLSMAMGAFLAGVLLSESTFRHQLEADVEPFRAILLGLFFLSVGMSLDIAVVLARWEVILGGVIAFMAVKAVAIYGIARLFKAGEREAVERAALFAQGGEFAFVLYAAALSVGIFDARVSASLTAIVILGSAIILKVSSFGLRIAFWIALGLLCAAFFQLGIGVIFGVIAALVAICWFIKGGRETLLVCLHALVEGARHAVPVGIACALVGVIIGVVSLTGVASTFAGYILAVGQDNLFLSLILTMLTCLVLGMGIPTIPNYIITSSIAAPALLDLGVPLIVSHMFVFYFGILADLTPPVALACFAAAPIAKETGLKISLWAVRIAIAGFVVPFMAVYNPALMLQGDSLWMTAYMLVKAAFAIGLWGIASIGYLQRPLAWWERVLGFAAGVTLIMALPVTDEIGFGIGALLLAQHIVRARRAGPALA